MNATANNGDVWSGERNGEYWIYADSQGRLYESLEIPSYRIVMDNAEIVDGAIRAINAKMICGCLWSDRELCPHGNSPLA